LLLGRRGGVPPVDGVTKTEVATRVVRRRPDLRGRVLGTRRPMRGRRSHLRSGADLVRDAPGGLLGQAQPDAGQPPGLDVATVPLGDLLPLPSSRSRDAGRRRRSRRGTESRRHARSSRRRRVYPARTTTSSTWRSGAVHLYAGASVAGRLVAKLMADRRPGLRLSWLASRRARARRRARREASHSGRNPSLRNGSSSCWPGGPTPRE